MPQYGAVSNDTFPTTPPTNSPTTDPPTTCPPPISSPDTASTPTAASPPTAPLHIALSLTFSLTSDPYPTTLPPTTALPLTGYNPIAPHPPGPAPPASPPTAPPLSCSDSTAHLPADPPSTDSLPNIPLHTTYSPPAPTTSLPITFQ